MSEVVSIGVGDASGLGVPGPHGERPTQEHKALQVSSTASSMGLTKPEA
jgi:hypothetical protein